jgi:hypothetical protein
MLFIVISGCATQFGKRYDKSVNVRLTSEPSHLGYYVISILENERLGGGSSPLMKNNELLKTVSTKNRITASEYWTTVKPGEYVLVIDCGDYVTRRQVAFEAGLNQTLRCQDR